MNSPNLASRHHAKRVSRCSLLSISRVEGDGVTTAGFVASAVQTARIASSSPSPVGTAGLGLLAKYHSVSGDLAVRLPGISSQPFGSVFRTQSHAYCSQRARYS